MIYELTDTGIAEIVLLVNNDKFMYLADTTIESKADTALRKYVRDIFPPQNMNAHLAARSANINNHWDEIVTKVSEVVRLQQMDKLL